MRTAAYERGSLTATEAVPVEPLPAPGQVPTAGPVPTADTATTADTADTATTSGTVAVDLVDLEVLDGQVTRLFALVADGIVAATRTFLESDREGAWLVVAAEREVDALFCSVEGLIRDEILSSVRPSSERLSRLLVTLQVVPEVERSGDLVEHIACRARQGLARSLTPTCRELILSMGRLASEMWRAAASGYLERDPTTAGRLRQWDDELDDLHVTLTSALAGTALPVASAIEMGLVARFLERLGDHAVNVARRLQCAPVALRPA